MRPRPAHPRRQDWPERLAELVEARRAEPFRWGAHDCCLFAADAVLALTGRDPAAAWRGRYATEAEAEAVLAEAGSLVETVALACAAAGLPEIPAPAAARRGDLALINQGNQPAMGVVLGEAIAAPGPDGLACVPLDRAIRAWAV